MRLKVCPGYLCPLFMLFILVGHVYAEEHNRWYWPGGRVAEQVDETDTLLFYQDRIDIKATIDQLGLPYKTFELHLNDIDKSAKPTTMSAADIDYLITSDFDSIPGSELSTGQLQEIYIRPDIFSILAENDCSVIRRIMPLAEPNRLYPALNLKEGGPLIREVDLSVHYTLFTEGDCESFESEMKLMLSAENVVRTPLAFQFDAGPEWEECHAAYGDYLCDQQYNLMHKDSTEKACGINATGAFNLPNSCYWDGKDSVVVVYIDHGVGTKVHEDVWESILHEFSLIIFSDNPDYNHGLQAMSITAALRGNQYSNSSFAKPTNTSPNWGEGMNGITKTPIFFGIMIDMDKWLNCILYWTQLCQISDLLKSL